MLFSSCQSGSWPPRLLKDRLATLGRGSVWRVCATRSGFRDEALQIFCAACASVWHLEHNLKENAHFQC